MGQFAHRTAAPAILVVDDDDLVRDVVSAVLHGIGHEVESARNGAEALEHITAGGAFKLILLDVQMPVLDGWATIAELLARGCQIPIVMMSGHASEADALSHGARELLVKPFDQARLVEVVSRWSTDTQESAAS